MDCRLIEGTLDSTDALLTRVTDMSTFNTSESESKWLVSPIIDGRTGSLPLSDVKNGTSISIDTYVDQSVSRKPPKGHGNGKNNLVVVSFVAGVA